MQIVESEGQKFVDIWNQITGREDRMQKSVKQGLFDLIPRVSLDKFRYRVVIYQQARSLCREHKLDRYLTAPVAGFDLSEFLNHINAFQQDDGIAALEKRIKTDHKKAVLRKVRSKNSAVSSEKSSSSKKTKLPALSSVSVPLSTLNPNSYQSQLLRKLTEVSRNKIHKDSKS